MPERLKLLCFRCRLPLYERLETFAFGHHLDRTSVINLALVSFFRAIDQRAANHESCTLEDLAAMLGEEGNEAPAPLEKR